jgi:hypothetical protein
MEIIVNVLEADLSEIANDLRTLSDLNTRTHLYGVSTAGFLLAAWVQIRNVQHGKSSSDS